MAAEVQQLRRPAVLRRNRSIAPSTVSAADHSSSLRSSSAYRRATPREPADLLGEVLEEVAVLLELDDLEPHGRQVRAVPVAAEAGREVVRRDVRQAAERRGEDEPPAGAEQPGELAQRGQRVGQVLEDLGAQDRVERPVRLGDRGDVADDVERRLVPRPGVQPGAVAAAVVLGEVLADVAEVAAEPAELLLARAGVEQPPAGGDPRQRPLDPRDARRLVPPADLEPWRRGRRCGASPSPRLRNRDSFRERRHDGLLNQKHPHP